MANLINQKYPETRITLSGNVGDDIRELYSEISRVSREVTQWDLYKTTEVIEDAKRFNAQVNALAPLSSAIIKTRIINDRGEVYTEGDLIFKKIDNSTVHIKAERGGVFYPQTIYKTPISNTNNTPDNTNNTFTVRFAYSPTEPLPGSVGRYGVDVQASEPQMTMTFDQEYDDTSSSTDYTSVYEVDNVFENNTWSATIPVIKSAQSTIRPIIKFFDESGEEVYCDYTIEETSSTWEIGGVPTSLVRKVVVK